MKEHEEGDAVFEDISDTIGQIALQGPKAKKILSKLVSEDCIPPKYYSAKFGQSINGMECIISQTGYTGSGGYEIYMKAEDAPQMWETLMEAGRDEGLLPCGLGARDTLRLEAGMPLYGHEMNSEITPIEADLGFAVKFKKDDFIGKAALTAKEATRIRVGLKVTGRGIVREHMNLYVGDALVGMTTSGTHAPYLGFPIAQALVDKSVSAAGTKMKADVRGRKVETEVVPLPFYSRTKK